MRILLLEDDGPLRYTYREALSQAGFDVYATDNLYDARNHIMSARPEVAILDLVIGRELSLDVAGLVNFMSPETEVVMVTGTQRFPSAELFDMKVEVAMVLRKPVDLYELIEVVRHIERRQSRVQPDGTASVVAM